MTRIALSSALIATVALASPAVAQDRGAAPQSLSADAFAQFAPQPDGTMTKLDFAYWDTALNWFVLRMGRSLREYEGGPLAQTGTRMVYGHDSPYRLEGNRVAFSMMPEDVRQALTDYRRDLESLPDSVPLARLVRNEQLAYWINLHNVAVIEQIALAYPVGSPSLVRPGDGALPLDETPFITVAGVKMSPQDIRTRIVYPNWRDPKVMYGFWHGDIGGPSISRSAFTAATVDALLDDLASEFVNSLRGVQRSGDTLLVSRLYLETRPFFFPGWPNDLRAHIAKYAEADVGGLLAETSAVDPRIAEIDIADLSKGETQPNLTNLTSNGEYQSMLVDGTVARLLTERKEKLERSRRENVREGRVIVLPSGEVPAEQTKTVE